MLRQVGREPSGRGLLIVWTSDASSLSCRASLALQKGGPRRLEVVLALLHITAQVLGYSGRLTVCKCMRSTDLSILEDEIDYFTTPTSDLAPHSYKNQQVEEWVRSMYP